MSLADTLLQRFPLISDQVSQSDVRLILNELEAAIRRGVPGDIVEFGCYIGTTSLFLRRALDTLDPKRTLHVYDSFAGLPAKSREDASPAGMQFAPGQLVASKKQLLREFARAGLAPPVVHKGWFDELTPADVPPQIAFAFLDGDFYASIRVSLTLVLPRLSPGSTVILHDYAREALPGVARAVREFGLTPAVQHGLAIIHQPPDRGGRHLSATA